MKRWLRKQEIWEIKSGRKVLACLEHVHEPDVLAKIVRLAADRIVRLKLLLRSGAAIKQLIVMAKSYGKNRADTTRSAL